MKEGTNGRGRAKLNESTSAEGRAMLKGRTNFSERVKSK